MKFVAWRMVTKLESYAKMLNENKNYNEMIDPNENKSSIRIYISSKKYYLLLFSNFKKTNH